MAKRSAEEYQYLLSVLDKAEQGSIIDQKVFDRVLINQKIRDLTDKYDIKWGEENIVPSDENLADRLFAAGKELALDTGVYCIDTKRRMIWSSDELEQALHSAPAEETLGVGKDRVTIKPRHPGDDIRVAVAGGPFGVPVPEDLFTPVMLSYAQEPLIDIIDNASLLLTHGRPIRAGSPWEAVACWQEARLIFEVLKRTGRPGMAIGCAENAPSAIGELATTTYGAFRPTDWHHNSFVSELKTTYSELTRAVHYAHTGCHSHGFYNPIYGGYVGGPEGVAIAIVAGLILMRACYGVTTMNAGPSHPHLSCDTHPDLIPAQAVAFQALARNTNLLIANFERPVAGPCTRDILYEVATLTIASVASGISLVECVQSAMGVNVAHATGLEARFAAQVTHASEGLAPKEANGLVRILVSKYADGQNALPIGKPFTEAYDLETIKPTEEWQQIYEEVCEELETEFGLKITLK
jgi:methylamine--corrinoid protein Co-methyltransferase